LRKFMVAFDEEVFRELNRDAKSKHKPPGPSQRVIVPEWIQSGGLTIAEGPTVRAA